MNKILGENISGAKAMARKCMMSDYKNFWC